MWWILRVHDHYFGVGIRSPFSVEDPWGILSVWEISSLIRRDKLCESVTIWTIDMPLAGKVIPAPFPEVLNFRNDLWIINQVCQLRSPCSLLHVVVNSRSSDTSMLDLIYWKVHRYQGLSISGHSYPWMWNMEIYTCLFFWYLLHGSNRTLGDGW